MDRPRIIRTAKSRPNNPTIIRRNNHLDNRIRAPNTRKRPNQDKKAMCIVNQLLEHAARPVLGMVVQPQPARQHDGERREADGAGERDQEGEDGDGLGEHKGHGAEADGAAQPGAPMHERVLLQVCAVAEDAHEAVLCGDVQVETARDHETD